MFEEGARNRSFILDLWAVGNANFLHLLKAH